MSENKCFCHLNGYEVKDARARAEIEELKKSAGGGGGSSVIFKDIDLSDGNNHSLIEGIETGYYELEICIFRNPSPAFQTIKLTAHEGNITVINNAVRVKCFCSVANSVINVIGGIQAVLYAENEMIYSEVNSDFFDEISATSVNVNAPSSMAKVHVKYLKLA